MIDQQKLKHPMGIIFLSSILLYNEDTFGKELKGERYWDGVKDKDLEG